MDTNYGANTLDIYAPGTDIYSAYMGDTYRTGTGEGLAAATVAGVATLIKSYFPKLTGSQIRDILLKSVTSRKGVEVEKGIRVDDRPSQDLFLFDDLCISGGIVNAYQAILEAEKMNSQRNDMKRAEILTGLWLLMFLIYGKECMSQIQNKVCDTIPYELVHNKIIIPVTINGVKTKYIVDTGGKTGTMYDIALEMQANAAGYTRISDVNGQGQNYQEAYVSNVSIGNSYQIKLLKTMVLPKDPFSLI